MSAACYHGLMQDSIWFRTLPRELRDTLQQSEELPEEAEVVIVGAGMAGLMTAYYLTEAGVGDIWVIDRSTALGEASGSNAGGLWYAQQSPEMGPLAALVAKTAELYDELGERFDFDLRKPGMLQLFFTAKEAARRSAIVKEVRQAGYRAESVSPKQIGELEPTLGKDTKGAVYYPDEGRLHPARLAGNLARYLREKEVRFALGVKVESIAPEIETAQGSLAAGTTVLTTGAWTPLLTAALGWKPPIKPMRGTLLAIEPMRQTLRHTVMTPNYYYWQLSEGHIAGGGSVEDVGFRRGAEEETVSAIRSELNELIPSVARRSEACRWSGFRPYCEDSKPVIGAVPGQDNMFVGAGHFKKGIMMAPVTGKILADLVTEGKTKLGIKSLNPGRFRRRKPK